MGEKVKTSSVSERLDVARTAGAGRERRAEGVLRDPEGLECGVSKDAV